MASKKHKDRLKGGLADKKKPTDFDSKALQKGAKVESEHTSDKAMAREIAMDHLAEDSKYYDKLAKMEGKKMEKKGTAKHLDHPDIKGKKLTNHCAKHLHHPQIPTGAGNVDPGGQELFDPKKGFNNE